MALSNARELASLIIKEHFGEIVEVKNLRSFSIIKLISLYRGFVQSYYLEDNYLYHIWSNSLV